MSNSSGVTERRHERRSIFWPLFLIAIGVLFLLDNTGFLNGDVWGLVLRFWPVLLIVGGLDGLWKGEGVAGSLFWMGVGIIFLLANLGYLNINVFDMILRFWPVLLVAVGLDLIIGRRGSAWAQILSVVLALALLGGLVWYAVVQPPILGQPMEGEQVRETLQGAKTAHVEVDMGAGQLNISDGATGDTLVEGVAARLSDQDVRRSYTVRNGQAELELKQAGVPFVASIDRNNPNRNAWDLNFNPAIPTDFNLNLGFGQGEIDLAQLQPTGVEATVAFGQLVVTLPEDGDFDVNANVVFGEVVLRVPKGLAVNIQGSRVFGGINVDGNFERNGDRISTPGAGSDAVDVKASTVFGSVRIVEIP